MSRVRYNITSKTAYELINDLKTDRLIIPDHQRGYVWTKKHQLAFINSVFQGIPTQSIIQKQDSVMSLEDGQQRLTTLRNFMDDALCVPTITNCSGKFSEMKDNEKNEIRMYQFSVTTYYNASTAQTIQIFDRFQNGVALKVGERIHSMIAISPLVSFVKRTLMTSDIGLHNRASLVWGVRDGEDKGRLQLLNATALCAGLAYGIKAITKKWSDFQDNNYLSRDVDENKVLPLLNVILSIYEAVGKVRPKCNKKNLTKILNTYWDVGKVTGYIAYSLLAFPDNIKILMDGWITFLIDAEVNPHKLKTVLQKDIDSTRNWKKCRWELGYRRVFHPDDPEILAADDAAEIDSQIDSQIDSDSD
jgi:hypothetical protein